jgi:glycine/D-amino acid oxidase-like deaminating enzyme
MSEADLSADVAIVGGGIMGSAAAFWITRYDPRCAVVVVERDPTYASASSALSAAGIRQQYTTEINVRISQASIEFLRDADRHLDRRSSSLGLREAGYLYLATSAGALRLQQRWRRQRALGVEVARLDRADLAERFPWLATGDLALGTLGLRGEGWFDGPGLLAAFASQARAQGVRYLRAEAVGFVGSGPRLEGIRLADGRVVRSAAVVNAAGPWARTVARWAGIELPVSARRRTVYVIECPDRLAGLPLLIDPSGFWIRPEGERYIAGYPPTPDEDGAPLEPGYAGFESVLWPALAMRIPAFESARLRGAWAGYYEMNDFDQNGLLGTLPDQPRLWFINGFSGHGLQQAPIVARGLAERILFGRYRALDLAALDVTRWPADRPLRELNVI